MTFRRQRSIIDAVPRVVGRVQESWTERKLADMLLMDIKGAFDDVSRNCLLCTMDGIGADGDLR